MPNTYTQLPIHLVFAVQHCLGLITETVCERLQQYLCAIVREEGHKPLAVYSMPDHTHLLLGLNPTQAIAELMRLLKGNSSKWLNETGLLPGRFEWQRGYGAFSYSRSQLPAVVRYILTQPKHRRRQTFREEYVGFLEKFEVDYDPRYLFE